MGTCSRPLIVLAEQRLLCSAPTRKETVACYEEGRRDPCEGELGCALLSANFCHKFAVQSYSEILCVLCLTLKDFGSLFVHLSLGFIVFSVKSTITNCVTVSNYLLSVS